MPAYDYSGISSDGKKVNGVLVATHERELEDRLRASGVWLLSSKERKAKTEQRGLSRRNADGPKVKRRLLIDFTLQLSVLLNAGFSLSDSLGYVQEDIEDEKFARVINTLRFNITSGVPMNEALRQFPKTFPPLYIELVKAGEESGNLALIMNDLLKNLEWSDSLVADARQATVYPAMVGVSVVLLVAVLFTFVVPRFTTLLSHVGVALPLPTRMVFGLSQLFTSWWWAVLLVIGLVWGALFTLNRTSDAFALGWEKVKLNMPIFGRLWTKIALSRFCHNLAVLYKSGIPMIDCFRMVKDVTGNPVVEKAIEQAAEEIADGEGIADSFRKHAVFEPMVLRMMAIGEASGQMGNALDAAAEFYEDEIPRAIKKFFSLLEPALIITLVAIVGFVALAIFLPLLSITAAIG